MIKTLKWRQLQQNEAAERHLAVKARAAPIPPVDRQPACYASSKCRLLILLVAPKARRECETNKRAGTRGLGS